MDPLHFIPTIFSTFRDLNLITLIHNLRRGQVARGNWIDGGKLCPLAHGMSSGDAVEQARDAVTLTPPSGVPVSAVNRFLNVWDDEELTNAVLAAELHALWRERRADADAVQGVLTAPLEPVVT